MATTVTCCVVVLACEPALIGLLRRAAVMDSPNERSSHSVPTPRGGGAPIAAALVVVSVLAYGRAALPFALAVGTFGAVGLIDDLRGLKAAVRLIGQAAISAVIAGLLIWQTAGRGPLGRLEGLGLPWPATAVIIGAAGLTAVIWLTGFVNAFNFMDGINGISAGHAIVGGVAYGFLGVLEHDSFIAAAGAAIAATGVAFLPWNAFNARVFLGDVGSYALGAGLAVLAIDAVLRGVPVEAAAAPWPSILLTLLDSAAAFPGPGALARAAPDARLPAALRCGLVSPAGCACHQPRQRGDLPARVRQPDRRSRSADRMRCPRRSALALYLSALPRLAASTDRRRRPDMRILLVTDHFPPEIGAPQARLLALARTWAGDGDEVTCSPACPVTRRACCRRRPRTPSAAASAQTVPGSADLPVRDPNEGIVRKTLGHPSFMLSSVLLGWHASRPADVVVVSSPTFFSIGSAWLLARRSQPAVVLQVRDLWPAIPRSSSACSPTAVSFGCSSHGTGPLLRLLML